MKSNGPVESFIRPIYGNKLISFLAPILLAILLKVSLLALDAVPFNSDEAIVALMARHMMHGERPMFFYGQAYMGSLDAALVAGLFSVFGEHVWVVRLVQIILFAGTISTTFVLGKKAFGSWRVGLLAAWLLAIPAVSVTLYTTVSLGGYGEALLLGNLILLAGLQLDQRIQEGLLLNVSWWSLIVGLLVGLGLWAFGLTLVYSIPTGIYLLSGLWRSFRNRLNVPGSRLEGWNTIGAAIGSSGFGVFLGAAPWWLYAVQNGFGQLLGELGGEAIAGVEGLSFIGQVFQHLLNLLLLGSTAIFGMRPPWEVRWLGLPLLPFVLMFWIGVILFAFRRLRQKDNLYKSSQMIIAAVAMTLVLAFVLSPFGVDPSGRYFLPIVVVLSLFAAEMILHLVASWGRWAWGLVGLVLAFNLWGTIQSALNCPPGMTTQFDPVAQIDHSYDQELISFLEEVGAYRGYSNYWVAYPLAFNSSEEMLFVPRLPYHEDFRYTERDDRYEPYDQIVAASERVAYITTNHVPLDDYLRTTFAGRGISWKEHNIGDYHIFYNLSRPVRPMEIGLGVTTP
jgi:4-amino-4-deoxy-L-arabinose transferase-like glycosyltransferase